ncbi:hypothetical protein B1748_07425 [Paenibacillus sp. MY03]|jgi:uncharacterized protein YoxC|uniref:DUF948 domain-containing protein n=1 Tax=Paenibacillus sp. MY03 TaxID=302980 RepID=UPI000B3D2AEB|nr:DUF948 domain-containing protein [Paenibacillus sp. MY03]OUS77616.1 hypothetical protein B1748_07425 [Paenibacillus sp. MY03]
MTMEWIATVAVAAFVIWVAGTLLAVRALLGRMARVQASAEAVQEDMHRLSGEMSQVLLPTEQTMRSLQQSAESAERLFQAVGQVGGTIEHATSAVERVTGTLSQSAICHAERIAKQRELDAAVQWAELGLTAWQLWQTGRKPPSGNGGTVSSAPVSSSSPK